MTSTKFFDAFSLVVTRGHSWSLVFNSWSLVVTRVQLVVTRGHSWSLVVIRGHSWSLVCTFRHDRKTGDLCTDPHGSHHTNRESHVFDFCHVI